MLEWLASVNQGYNLSQALSVDNVPTNAKLFAAESLFQLIIGASVDSGLDFKQELSD